MGTTIVQRKPNPRYEQFISRRDALEQEKVRLEVSLEARGPSQFALHDRLDQATLCSSQHAEFEREAAEVEQRIGELIAAHERTEVLGVINEEERMSNLVVLQEASLPTVKSGPQRTKPSLIGLVLGGVAGVALALGLQVLDNKIRSARDIESHLKMRVLGVVPEQRVWRKAGRRALQAKPARG